MEDMTDWLIRRENSIGQEETADKLKHKYEKALDDLAKYEKERQEDKEKIKELEKYKRIAELTNNKIKEEIKEIIKYHEYARDLAGEELTTTTVVADSDSLNFGRIQAHNVAISKLQDLLNNKTS